MSFPEPGTGWRRTVLAFAAGLLAASCAHGDAAPAPAAQEASRAAPVAREPGPEHRLIWPVEGRIISPFGNRRATHVHQGLDIKVPRGTRIRAAAAGRVRFSGRMNGYGNVVILEHEGDLETVYAHNRTNLVRKGDRVARGQVIAEAGATGNATTPHLHFEVREAKRPRDPAGYLPRAYPASPAR